MSVNKTMQHPWFAQYLTTYDPAELWFEVERQMFAHEGRQKGPERKSNSPQKKV